MISQHLIAHRGWQNQYPENTLIAIKKAIEVGAKQIEIDIQLSADHTPFLSHDNVLTRLCDIPDDINRLTDKQLQQLSVYEPQRLGQVFSNTPMCTLSQCVNLISEYPQVTLFAEIKQHSIQTFGVDTCLSAILPLLQKIHHHCIIISFDEPILIHAKKAGWHRIGPVLSDWQQAFTHQTKQLNPEIIFCDVDLFTDHKTPADVPFPTAIYEIGSYEQANKLLQQGAKLIETFCIGELILEDK